MAHRRGRAELPCIAHDNRPRWDMVPPVFVICGRYVRHRYGIFCKPGVYDLRCQLYPPSGKTGRHLRACQSLPAIGEATEYVHLPQSLPDDRSVPEVRCTAPRRPRMPRARPHPGRDSASSGPPLSIRRRALCGTAVRDFKTLLLSIFIAW